MPWRNWYGNPEQRKGLPSNMPILAITTAVLLVGFAVLVVVMGYGDQGGGALLVGLVLTTVPSLIAAAFAERVSRDVRNGVVEHKAKHGAKQALHESGMTPAQLQRLADLLRINTAVTVEDMAERRDEGNGNGE